MLRHSNALRQILVLRNTFVLHQKARKFAVTNRQESVNKKESKKCNQPFPVLNWTKSEHKCLHCPQKKNWRINLKTITAGSFGKKRSKLSTYHCNISIKIVLIKLCLTTLDIQIQPSRIIESYLKKRARQAEVWESLVVSGENTILFKHFKQYCLNIFNINPIKTDNRKVFEKKEVWESLVVSGENTILFKTDSSVLQAPD